MLDILRCRTYRHLFLAQVVALVGTGLATVALGLLAFDLSGDDAGAVLGTALAIKMIAYVCVSPVAAAIAERLPRRAALVGLDIFRAAMAAMLPFVDAVWQVYLLIFLLQSASAAFTPTFQASIPDVLPDEKSYTQALTLSRLAYDLESLASPVLAAALLVLMSFHDLFAMTAFGFLVSAGLVASVAVPGAKLSERRGIYARMTRGARIFLATPRLRGLLAVNLAVAAAGAMVFVNTVVIVQGEFGLPQTSTAIALACFGGGSMIVALTLPRLLDRISDRTAMLAGVVVATVGLLCGPAVDDYVLLLPLWAMLGAGYSLAQTPAGRLLRRSAHPEDRPALYAAQFAFSHLCWLATYPLAGWLGSTVGMGVAFLGLAAIAGIAFVAAVRIWPADDPEVLAHEHRDLAEDDLHWPEGQDRMGKRHRHPYVIDDQHTGWPR